MNSNQKKKAIIIGVVLAVLLAAGITSTVLLRTNQPLYTKLSIALMPESIEYTDPETDEKITFYIEENKDYNPKKDEPINAYNSYYLNDKDEKVYLEDGVYMSAKELAESKKQGKKDESVQDGVKYNVGVGQQVTVGFLISAQEKANKVTAVVKVIVAIFAICCVIYLIYLWYLNWSKRQDKKAAKLAEAQEILDRNNE